MQSCGGTIKRGVFSDTNGLEKENFLSFRAEVDSPDLVLW